MERNTRVKKYKELRESMKEEVSIDRTLIIEEEDEEDDFLSFLPKEEEKEVDIEDTLNKPLTYETLDESEDVTEALNIAKMNVGKSQYDTRIDILNKIKNDQKVSEEEDYSTGYIVDGSEKNTNLMDKLATMSADDNVRVEKSQPKPVTKKPATKKPETKKEEPVKPVPKTPINNEKAKEELFNDEIELMEDYKEEKDNESAEDEPKEKGDILMTILNVIIIVLIVVFVFFIVLFLRQLFF